jgi:hypothetical protein
VNIERTTFCFAQLRFDDVRDESKNHPMDQDVQGSKTYLLLAGLGNYPTSSGPSRAIGPAINLEWQRAQIHFTPLNGRSSLTRLPTPLVLRAKTSAGARSFPDGFLANGSALPPRPSASGKILQNPLDKLIAQV